MSVNIRDYVSDDHVESTGEILRSQSAIIQALLIDNSDLENQLQEKENIIKEVRDYAGDLRLFDNESLEFEISNELFEILDKGE